jgi:hypothetical protein
MNLVIHELLTYVPVKPALLQFLDWGSQSIAQSKFQRADSSTLATSHTLPLPESTAWLTVLLRLKRREGEHRYLISTPQDFFQENRSFFGNKIFEI